MEKLVTNDIIFLINITDKESFAKCSNFINKVSKNEMLGQEETNGILFKRGEIADGEVGSRVWHKCMEKKYAELTAGRTGGLSTDFNSIKQPEKIINLSDPFSVVYYLRFEEQKLSEVVQYRDLILLIGGYKDMNILAHIIGSTEFYFKLSQYLSWIINEFSLRNCIFFTDINNGECKRLQENSVLQSTGFLPLIMVNQMNVKRLREKCEKQLGEPVFKKILSQKCKYKEVRDEITWRELGGIVMQFLNCKDIFLQIERELLESVLKQLDVLAFALLVYSMKGYKGSITIAELNSYAKQQQQYANACHQLMENILFHSVSKWGILSVRVHRAEGQNNNHYLESAYGKGEILEDYFEVHICDFAAGESNQNIAEHFLGQLDNNWKNKFQGMKPIHLFKSALGVEDSYIEPWKEYYRTPRYFGKHFGLRIFQGITKTNQGFFWAESHTNHKMNDGEYYCYEVPGIRQNYVMPGTAYGILLPLKKSQDQVKKDITQEYGNWLCRAPERLLKMTVQKYETRITGGDYQNQDIKENIIKQMASDIQQFIESNSEKTDIISIDASILKDNEAELWGKAVLIAQFSSGYKPHMVFYDCTDMFMDAFKNMMIQIFDAALEGIFWNENFQIALITKEGVQTVFLPCDAKMTDTLNQYSSRIKGMRYDTIFKIAEENLDIDKAEEVFVPYDILIQVDGLTLFERYVCKILEQDIQSEQYGCKINSTHMRLGSTVHISQFYEAELMFGNSYFISRFAFLILKDIYDSLLNRKDANITLYGYASYSETLLVVLSKAMLALSEELDLGLDVDYILLEREEERREMTHIDRIRYGRMFSGKEDKMSYLNTREYIVIVPINSTMKTHQRLISLLKEENTQITDDNILRNYALILIGPDKCDYWKTNKMHILECKYFIKPNPKYFVHVWTEYQESLECDMCFPEDVVLERPLIEVNAASTIPNQAFGIVTGKQLSKKNLNKMLSYIEAEGKKLEVLKNCLVYGHMTRNDTHFLYYIKTEELAVSAKEKILESLGKWKSNIRIKNLEYHIIVAPMHYSDCQFVEMVNEQIFSGMASVIRIDFNKDYRNNAYAKYSNIRQYLRQLAEMGKEIEVKFHFVDDNIITGRTFYRAKSMIESIVGFYHESFPNVKTVIFDRIFVLVDRNSLETRMQYLNGVRKITDVDRYFYCFLNIKVSSLRNYGDSCVICNLYKDAKRLRYLASTGIVADHWGWEDEKFQVNTVEKFIEKKRQENEEEKIEKYKQRAYRRLFCTHMIKVILDEVGFDNQTEYVGKILLTMLIEDYRHRSADQKEAFEYFISYLKVCSRPFLVFQKPIKEAIYDILLILIECIIKKEPVNNVLRRGGKEKGYWKCLKDDWNKLERKILKNLDVKQQRDLVLVIMKQLTELKSNYIIRLDNINAFFEFAESFNEETDIDEDKGSKLTLKEDFWRRYVMLIKKLTGVSSDTSKSMWLDYALLHGKELKWQRQIVASEKIDPVFSQIIRLENTTNFHDGIMKIYNLLKTDETFSENLILYTETFYSDGRVNGIMNKYLSHWRSQMLTDKAGYSFAKWREEFLKHTSDKCFACPGNIKDAFMGNKNVNEVWECLNRKLEENNVQEDDDLKNKLRQRYEKATDGYQFLNFRKLMCEMKWRNEIFSQEGALQEYCYSDEGIRQITCCLAIKKLCEEADYTEEALLERIGKIAKLVGAMLGDAPVQILAEYLDSSEYYKKAIEQLVEEKRQELKIEKNDLLPLQVRKHYHTIGDNTGRVIALEEEVQSLLNDPSVLDRLEKYGYYYEGETFFWLMGRKSRYPLYLYAKTLKGESNFLYKIRNLLSLSSDIEKSLFAAGKQNYLHEVDLANSRLSVLNREKSYIHTREENRTRNYKRLVEGGKSSRHDSLVLLADLNVSRIYRDSLNKEFYQRTNVVDDKYMEMEFTKQEIHERMHGAYSEDEPVVIKISIESKITGDRPLQEKEKLIFFNDSEQDVMSLLLALILNVKEWGREIKSEQENVISVFLSKTSEGVLRILNETNCDEVELDKIKNCLHKEPTNEESGITLWSLNACIRRAIVCYLCRELERIEDRETKIEKINRFLRHLTENTFEIKLDIKQLEGNRYFSFELPILWELYDKSIK